MVLQGQFRSNLSQGRFWWQDFPQWILTALERFHRSVSTFLCPRSRYRFQLPRVTERRAYRVALRT